MSSKAPKSTLPSSPKVDTALKIFGLDSSQEKIDVPALLSRALSRGGTLAEIFFEETASTRITFEDGKLEQAVDGIDRGAGFRVIFDNRQVSGYTTDLTQSALERLAESLSSAIENPSEPPQLAQVEWIVSQQPIAELARYQIKKDPRGVSLVEKVKIAARMDRAARAEISAADGTIRQVSAYVLDSKRRILVMNSEGMIAPDEKTYFTLMCEVVGEKEGRTESAYEGDGGFVGHEFLDERKPEDIAREVAQRVKVLLNAKPAPAGTLPVVLSAEAGGTMIHEAVGHGLEADLACNGLSVYQNKIGQAVASSLITVIDDGTMHKRRGSFRFDDEGTAAKKTVLIENGILKGYMVDRLSAMKFDLMATGNGRRESFRHKPIVRMTNTYIAPGKDDPAQILRDTPKGIFVKSMGGGQVNTVTGDFVFAVTEGYLIEDGKLGSAIRGATLVGNGPHVMKIVDRVGSDLGFSNGTCGKDGQGAPVTDAQPTIRIPELTVGGEVPPERYWKTSV